MMEWASENEPAAWNHYFNYISLNKAVWDIKDGKVSFNFSKIIFQSFEVD